VCSAGLCSFTSTCCLSDGECDDFNPCTQDACDKGKCVYTAASVPGCCSPTPLSNKFDGSDEGWASDPAQAGLDWHWKAWNNAKSPPGALHFGDKTCILGAPDDRKAGLHWLERLRGLGSEEWASAWKMDVIVRDHPEFFAALRRWLDGGHELVFVFGNHDLELHWPAVQERVRQAIGGDTTRVRFCEWFYVSDGDTFVTHGHQYDPYCAADPVHPLIEVRGKSRVRIPFGDLANRFMLNGMGYFNPHATNNYIMSGKQYVRFFFKYMVRTQPLLLWTWFLSCTASLALGRPLVSEHPHHRTPPRPRLLHPRIRRLPGPALRHPRAVQPRRQGPGRAVPARPRRRPPDLARALRRLTRRSCRSGCTTRRDVAWPGDAPRPAHCIRRVAKCCAATGPLHSSSGRVSRHYRATSLVAWPGDAPQPGHFTRQVTSLAASPGHSRSPTTHGPRQTALQASHWSRGSFS